VLVRFREGLREEETEQYIDSDGKNIFNLGRICVTEQAFDRCKNKKPASEILNRKGNCIT